MPHGGLTWARVGHDQALRAASDTPFQHLSALSLGEPLPTSALAKKAGLHRHVARMRAEELEAIGVVEGHRDGADLDEEHDRRPVTWRLAGDDGQVIASVFAEHRTRKRWHEIMVTHSSTPQDQEEDHQDSHERDPDFVPPPAAAETAPRPGESPLGYAQRLGREGRQEAQGGAR